MPPERRLSVPAGIVGVMEIWIIAIVALLVGAAVAWLLARGSYGAALAAASAERDVLRERVLDLEAAATEDREVARQLAPLRQTLDRVQQHVSILERERAQQFGSVTTLLSQVEAGTSEVSRATAALAGSLRSANVRGAWGEVQLRRVLELAGMLARCDFEEQIAATNALGASVRPDVVVRLPGEKVLVVDAKAPMAAFLEAQVEGLSEQERADLLNAHARSLAEHVRALSRKSYWSAFETTPELVVCFVPSEAMLATALACTPGLHESALAQKVVIVGPGSLLALLKSVAVAWQQDALTASARELLVLGRDLHQRLGSLGGHVSKVGRSLKSSVEAYNAMVGALESRVLVTSRRMSELAGSTEALPETPIVESAPRPLTAIELIDAATEEDERDELLFALSPAPADETVATGA